ncbi:MAG TPA: permease, partial [Thermoleophilaceae bacterium]
VCECGSVPVARRLLLRGLDPAAGVAFMLAAPILNPIVLASTWVAYQGHGRALEMTAARAGFGLLAATIAGLAIARRTGGDVLRPDVAGSAAAHEHAHRGRPGEFSQHLAGDFFFMAKYLVLGAAASAILQTVLPQSFVSGIGGQPVLAALTMVGIAFALSLCSEADAFVAVSFTAFPLGPQLAFLVAGPMLDTKLTALYGATFKRSFLPLLALIVVPVAVAASLFMEAVL